MNENVLVMLQTVVRSMQAAPALAQRQMELMRQQFSGADPLALREPIELGARPGATAQSVATTSAPILDRLISKS